MLKDSGPGAGLGRKHERVRAALVISEVALACVLLVSAGLLLRSFVKVLDVDLGFQPDRAASIKVDYDDSAPSRKKPARAKRGAIFQQIIARVSALPGVEAAGMADYLPLGPNREWDAPVPKGKTFAPGRTARPACVCDHSGIHSRHGNSPARPRLHLGRRAAERESRPDQRLSGSRLLARRRCSRQDSYARQREKTRGRGGRRCPRRNRGGRNRLANLLPGNAAGSVRSATGGPHQSAAGDACRERPRALRELNPKQPAAEFRPSRPSSTVRSRHAASSCCWSPRSPDSVCCWPRSAFTASSPIRSRGRRQRSAFAWPSAPASAACSAQVLAGTLRLALAGMVLGTLRCARSGAADFFAAVRHVVVGLADLSWNGAGAAAGRSRLRLHSCAARVWHQPDGGVAQQLTCRVD